MRPRGSRHECDSFRPTPRPIGLTSIGAARERTGHPLLLRKDVGSFHMLGTEPDADYAGGDSPQDGPAPQEFQRPGKGERLLAAEDTPDDVVLNKDLQAL